MALDYFWNIVFYCGCRHFLAKTTLYFDQKKMPTWVSGQTKDIKILQKLQRDSRYYSIFKSATVAHSILMIAQLKSKFCVVLMNFSFLKELFYSFIILCVFLIIQTILNSQYVIVSPVDLGIGDEWLHPF